MASFGRLLNTLGQFVSAFIGVMLVFAALYFYYIHRNIEDAMEGVCDSGDVFVEVLTYDDCSEAQQSSNSLRTWSFGCGFFGLLLMYYANKSHSEAKKNEQTMTNTNVPNVNVKLPKEDVTDKFSEIERLGELKDKGLLTEEEFQAEKLKLLK
mgnify:CR=1 FL=1